MLREPYKRKKVPSSGVEELASSLWRRGASAVELEGANARSGASSEVLSFLRHRSPVAAQRQRSRGCASSQRATPRKGRERVPHTLRSFVNPNLCLRHLHSAQHRADRAYYIITTVPSRLRARNERLCFYERPRSTVSKEKNLGTRDRRFNQEPHFSLRDRTPWHYAIVDPCRQGCYYDRQQEEVSLKNCVNS